MQGILYTLALLKQSSGRRAALDRELTGGFQKEWWRASNILTRSRSKTKVGGG